MCCNTKPGPRAAIAFFKKKTGIYVSQEDWHKVRTAAEVSLGRKLSNSVADSRRAAIAAAELADSLDATPQEKRDLMFSFASQRNTDGSVETVRHLAREGLPKEVADKKGRKNAKQDLVENALLAAPVELPWVSADEDFRIERGPLSNEDLSAIMVGDKRMFALDKPFEVNSRYVDEGTGHSWTVWAQDDEEAREIATRYFTQVKGLGDGDYSIGQVRDLSDSPKSYEWIPSDEENEYAEYLEAGGRSEEYDDDAA
jgi:hypothetical protein